MANKKGRYAGYIGDRLVWIGTIEEVAEELGIKKATAQWYSTPSWRKRAKPNSKIVERID